MLKAKVCVLVSGGGTNLQAIIDATKSGVINSAEVAVVVASNPTAYALERAKQNGIPGEVVHKKKLNYGQKKQTQKNSTFYSLPICKIGKTKGNA